MPPVPAGLDVQESRQPELYAASLATYALAVIAVNLRILSRRLLKSHFWLDDFFAIAALVIGSYLQLTCFHRARLTGLQLAATGFLVSTLVCRDSLSHLSEQVISR